MYLMLNYKLNNNSTRKYNKHLKKEGNRADSNFLK